MTNLIASDPLNIFLVAARGSPQAEKAAGESLKDFSSTSVFGDEKILYSRFVRSSLVRIKHERVKRSGGVIIARKAQCAWAFRVVKLIAGYTFTVARRDFTI